MSTSRRVIALRVAAVLTLAGVLAGCVSREESAGTQVAPATVPLSELSDVTLQIGDQKGGTESLLNAAGVLTDLPYKVVFSTFTSGPPQIEAATAGKIDFAITGNTPPIFGAAAGAKVKVVTAYENGATATASWYGRTRPSRPLPTCAARAWQSARAAPPTDTSWLSCRRRVCRPRT